MCKVFFGAVGGWFSANFCFKIGGQLLKQTAKNHFVMLVKIFAATSLAFNKLSAAVSEISTVR